MSKEIKFFIEMALDKEEIMLKAIEYTKICILDKSGFDL